MQITSYFFEKSIRKIITQAVHDEAKEEPGESSPDSSIKSLTFMQMCLNSYLNSEEIELSTIVFHML